ERQSTWRPARPQGLTRLCLLRLPEGWVHLGRGDLRNRRGAVAYLQAPHGSGQEL
ncbi:MAG: hypothetical protein AVDCRST_MAG37-1740, partial [uncultured Rubrobacteraceae bacterium]